MDDVNAHEKHFESRCEGDNLCIMHKKNSRVRCSCLHHPVGYRESLSTVNEINCNKKDQLKIFCGFISKSNQTCPSTMCLKRISIRLYCSGWMGSLTCSADSWCSYFSSRQQLENRTEVSLVDFLAAHSRTLIFYWFFCFSMSSNMFRFFVFTQFGVCRTIFLDFMSIMHCPQMQYTNLWFLW